MKRVTEDDLARALGGPSREARAEALRRLGETARGRERVAGDDPSRLFALLGAEPVPRQVLDQVSTGVASAIRRELDRSRFAGGRRWMAAGALAAGLALAALLGLELNRPLDRAAAGFPRVEPEGAATAMLPGERSRPGLELRISDSSARVFDLAVGDVQVVMIFDERLEL